MQDSVVIETHGLRKQFGTVRAVDGIDLCVRRGEVYGFLGPNGAGKTTTIGMILGLIHPSAGSVRVLGQEVTPANTRALARVGSLVGQPALTPFLSGRENLRMTAVLHPEVDEKRIEAVLELVGLRESANRPAGSYSTGMKQRLGLGIALLAQPELLVLDEPTNGMDPAGMREVRLLLAGLAEQGITVFLSSHLLHEIEQVCTRVAVLNAGRIVTEGTVTELLGRQYGAPALLRLILPHAVQAERAEIVLAALPGVSGVQRSGETITLHGMRGEDTVRALAGQGIYPSEVIRERADLETLFLELTKGEDAL